MKGNARRSLAVRTAFGYGSNHTSFIASKCRNKSEARYSVTFWARRNRLGGARRDFDRVGFISEVHGTGNLLLYGRQGRIHAYKFILGVARDEPLTNKWCLGKARKLGSAVYDLASRSAAFYG